MIRRPPRSTLSSSSAASDVYKRQVSTQSTGRAELHHGVHIYPQGYAEHPLQDQQNRRHQDHNLLRAEQQANDDDHHHHHHLSLIHISEPTRLLSISYAVFCLKKKKKKKNFA
eukprot:TRINITY_DN9405_c0_g1_i6.p1 TRINITY_DN9405_c0_g1~~TRINITY_DN9405_c0_g1_i6.p1  ORF type:complete len:113 (-),score=47.63 TRINITY_DN9405_c0_g1_i6:110-448(-)